MALVLSIVLLTNFWVPESDFEDSLDLPTTSYLQLGASGGEDERGQLVADLADLAGWLVGLFVGWLVGCLAGLLAVCPAGCLCCLAGWLAGCPSCLLPGWLAVQIWNPVLGSIFGSSFWDHFWDRFLGPVFGSKFGSIFGSNFGTHFWFQFLYI